MIVAPAGRRTVPTHRSRHDTSTFELCAAAASHPGRAAERQVDQSSLGPYRWPGIAEALLGAQWIGSSRVIGAGLRGAGAAFGAVPPSSHFRRGAGTS